MDGLIDERGREKKKEGRARMSHRTKPYDRHKGGAAGKTIHEDKLTQANACAITCKDVKFSKKCKSQGRN